MATFETLPRFESGWQALGREQQVTFQKVVVEAFEPDLAAPGQGFRSSLRVREVRGLPGLFEMSWGDDGRATFSYGPELAPGQPHVIWHQITSAPDAPGAPGDA